MSTLLKLAPATLLGALAMDIYIPCIPTMPEALDTTDALIQLSISIYMLGIGLGQIIFGPITDRVGRKPSMLTGLIIYFVSSIVTSTTPHIEMFLAARFVQSLGACFALNAAFAMVRDVFELELQPRAYSYMGSLIGIAPITAPLIGGYLLDYFGTYKACFIFLVIFSGIVIIHVAFNLTESLKHEHKMPLNFKIFQNYYSLLKDFRFVSFSLILGISMTVLYLFFAMSPIIFIEILGVPETKFGFYFGANAITITTASIIAPEVVKKTSVSRAVLIGLLLIVLAGFVMYGLQLKVPLTPLIAILPMLVAAFGIGLINGPASAKAVESYAHMAGTANAMANCIRFVMPFIVAFFVMQYEITSTDILGASMFVLGSFGIIVVFVAKIFQNKFRS